MLDTISHGAASRRPFLIVAHPGHELRLFNWMERERPRVFILSDGSGGSARSRIDYSRSTLKAAGATEGDLFGPLPDRAWYAAMLAGDPRPFLDAVTRIVAAARRERPTLLVSDAVDGHNPLHDLCQAIGSAVATLLAAEEGADIRYVVAAATATGMGRAAECWRLDEAAAARKHAAVTAYTPLAEEAQRILMEEPEALVLERLLHPTFDWPRHASPDWEAFGRKRVAAGRFASAVTYGAHVLPLARLLLRRAPADEGLRNSALPTVPA